MEVRRTRIPDVLLLVPKVFTDERGFFMESYNARTFAEVGITQAFVQDNHSRSVGRTLRGLHYQIEHAQDKLVRVIEGEVFDVAVDLRRSSATFGQWVGEHLSASNKHQLWVPRGFAHGFYVSSDVADVIYKCTDFYHPEHERCLRWDDPEIGVVWPIAPGSEPLVSKRDSAGSPFSQADVYK